MASRIDIHITENPKYDAAMTGIRNITNLVESQFGWTIDAQGGFASAHLNMKMSEVDAFQFMNTMVGRRIVFTHPEAPGASMICWEGLIYTVGVNDGKVNVSRSMQDVYNSVRVQYAERVQDGGGQTITGQTQYTAITTNTTSIAAYGTRENLYTSPSHASNVDATGLRDVILAEYANPRPVLTAAELGTNSMGDGLTVTVDCVGFMETLSKRLYVNASPHAYNQNIDVVLKALLTAVGEMVNSDQTNIAANSTRTEYDGFTGKVSAKTIIDALCAKGYSSPARRAYFGLYADRIPYYYQEPTSAEYIVRKYDGGERVINATTGAIVHPWLVRPGRIVRVPDLVPDEVTYSAALSDPRQFVIASVRFTAPNTLMMMPQSQFPGTVQKMAQLGGTPLGYVLGSSWVDNGLVSAAAYGKGGFSGGVYIPPRW